MNREPALSAAEPPPALEVTGLHAGYEATEVLRGVSLTVPAGAVVALLGPNGAGKTTLLRTISGLVRATAGHVRLAGQDVTDARPNLRAASGLVHVPEGRGIFRGLTVEENLRIQASLGSEGDAMAKAVAAFPILGQRRRQRAGTMSGGQQQMLALAAAYVREPSLILVDEPSLGLAPIIVDEIFEFLRARAAEGASILLVDQFAEQVLALATSAYIMRKGEIAFSGTAQDLLGADLFAHYVGVADAGTP
ncbi:ABC transporter ATP-binding protein [Kribbella sp. CWNU-51]